MLRTDLPDALRGYRQQGHDGTAESKSRRTDEREALRLLDVDRRHTDVHARLRPDVPHHRQGQVHQDRMEDV